jgi:hypothetical protein
MVDSPSDADTGKLRSLSVLVADANEGTGAEGEIFGGHGPGRIASDAGDGKGQDGLSVEQMPIDPRGVMIATKPLSSPARATNGSRR